jgi:uncharacterized protein (DUF2132 family)
MAIQNPDPLHGKTLQMILEHLVDYYGWEMLGIRVPINCFRSDPSMSSSLKFLRRTPWAREEVENLYREVIQRAGKMNTQIALNPLPTAQTHLR